MKATEKTFEKVIKKECSSLNHVPPDTVYWLSAKKCFQLAEKMCDEREKQVKTQIVKDIKKMFE